MESVVCNEEFKAAGFRTELWINSDMQPAFKERINDYYREYGVSLKENKEHIINEIVRLSPDVVLFDVRKIENDFLSELGCRRNQKTKIVCIDEWGHRRLDCDMIINPMVDPYYFSYPGSEAKILAGPEYLVLFPEIIRYHKMKKEIRNDIERILITFGGTDPYGHTYTVLDYIRKFFTQKRVDVVIGGGFEDFERIKNMTDGYDNINVFRNITFMYDLIYSADLVFCAGGNTLHECACIGSPALIMPSALHEVRNAKEFERRGFGYYIKNDSDIEYSLGRIRPVDVRLKMSQCGKNINDGNGYKRIVQNVIELI